MARNQTVVVAEKFDGVVSRGKGGIHVPVDGDPGKFLSGILYRFAGGARHVTSLEMERSGIAQ